MLTFLSIRNFLLFKDVDIDFSPYLNVLTGETGAGKSILIDAINVAFGAKTSPDMIFHDQEHAVITLSFKIPPQAHNLSLILEEYSIPTPQDEIIIRRDIFREGRARSRVNDTVVSSGLLASLKEYLLIIQGQFDPHGLLSQGKHLPLLDAYAHVDVSSLSLAFREWNSLHAQWETASSQQQQNQEQQQLLLFHLQELENLNPQPLEAENLENKVTQLKKAHLILENLNQAYNFLNEQSLPHLERALSLVEHPQISETFPDLVPLLRSGREETFAACELVSQYAEDIMLESDNIQEYEDRLYAFRDLARKHKTEPQLLVDLIPSLQQQAQNLKDIEHQEEILKEKVEEAKKHYLHLAQGISQKRKDAALRLSDTVHRELALLDMPKARFHVEITPLSLEKCGAFGLEQVSFLLATNPHHKPASLAKIASGGELNRLLLAIQSGLASRHLYPSMIFDEIDSGIGGKTAAILAQRLAWLAQTSQILAVTHAPQVAAYGEHHFFVAKDEKSSSTTVSLLSPSERVEDIARMISGTTINESARHAAEKLILEAKTLSPVKKRLSS